MKIESRQFTFGLLYVFSFFSYSPKAALKAESDSVNGKRLAWGEMATSLWTECFPIRLNYSKMAESSSMLTYLDYPPEHGLKRLKALFYSHDR